MIQYSKGLLLIAAMFHDAIWILRFVEAMAIMPSLAAAERFGSGATGPLPKNWPAPPVVVREKKRNKQK